MSYEKLPWDSEFFGFPIGRVADRVESDALAEAVARADADGIRCLYYLVAAGDLGTLHGALSHGFKPYDVRVEFERRLDSPDLPDAAVAVREAEPRDEPVVATLAARTSFATRFTRDGHFPRGRIPLLYAEWVRRGLMSGSARRVLLAEPAAGFVVCGLPTGESTGSIELIGVDSDSAGRGIGRALVAQAHSIMVAAGCERATVVTQGDNIPAQRLYQSLGYRTLTVAWWLHRWTRA